MAVITYTYQDFERREDTAKFALAAIGAHKASDAYRLALMADKYDRQENVTVNEYARYIYGMRVGEGPDGEPAGTVTRAEDFTASNNKLASNFFNRLNTQRVDYSLGAGISFVQPDEEEVEDETKAAMGRGFDHQVHEAAYYACIHGVCFPMWNVDHVDNFKLTEFVPLYDEEDGTLRAGIRFWQLDSSRPLNVTVFTEDGFSQWRAIENGGLAPLDRNGEPTSSEVVQAYRTTTAIVPADGEVTIAGEENYGRLPIVPMWASRLKQSTLVGMRAAIDAYDLVKSGFANDVQDCATVFWIIKNAGGMTDADIQEFMDRLRLQHAAKVDGYDGAEAVPYTQEIPVTARVELLKELRQGIYEDFGALDVHTVSAGATNDHIDAAYQPMDENASNFEYWVGSCIEQLVRLAGMEDSPIFSRQRISNQKEQVEMVVQEAQWLDTRTILQLLPNVKPDQVAAILKAMEDEDMGRFGAAEPAEPAQDEVPPMQ